MANSVDLHFNRIPLNTDIIVDTNVLIYLFDSNTTDDKGYSFFLNDALSNGCQLYINSQIISEYINVLCRKAYSIYNKNNSYLDYKAFRQTTEYENAYREALQTLEDEILEIVDVLPIKLSDVKESLCSQSNLMDYNDVIHLAQANRVNFSIVTHDRDIINSSGDTTVYHY